MTTQLGTATHIADFPSATGVALARDADAHSSDRMDTARAFSQVRKVLDTIVALQPQEGRATRTGTTLVWRHADGSGYMVSYQHVAGGTLRVTAQDAGTDGVYGKRYATPLQTDAALTDHLRALLVTVLG